MRSYFALLSFIIALSITYADAQWEGVNITHIQVMEMKQKEFDAKVMDWRLFNRSKNNHIEAYYDAANIDHGSGDSVIVSIKTVFKDEKAINAIKKMRKHNLKISPVKSEDLKYDDFAYTLETMEISCSSRKLRYVDLKYDFDKEDKIINLVPSVHGSLQIHENSTDDKLHKILCPKN